MKQTSFIRFSRRGTWKCRLLPTVLQISWSGRALNQKPVRYLTLAPALLVSRRRGHFCHFSPSLSLLHSFIWFGGKRGLWLSPASHRLSYKRPFPPEVNSWYSSSNRRKLKLRISSRCPLPLTTTKQQPRTVVARSQCSPVSRPLPEPPALLHHQGSWINSVPLEGSGTAVLMLRGWRSYRQRRELSLCFHWQSSTVTTDPSSFYGEKCGEWREGMFWGKK